MTEPDEPGRPFWPLTGAEWSAVLVALFVVGVVLASLW